MKVIHCADWRDKPAATEARPQSFERREALSYQRKSRRATRARLHGRKPFVPPFLRQGKQGNKRRPYESDSRSLAAVRQRRATGLGMTRKKQRLAGSGGCGDAFGVLVDAALMEDQFSGAAAGVGDESDLEIAQKEIAVALWEYLDLRLRS
ncbi:MAG: hypothetical protein WA153_09755 [Candidatus Acidiferrales bacterium]